MIARMVTITAYQGKFDSVVAMIHDRIEPMVRQRQGFRGIALLGNHRSNTVTVLSLWHHAIEEEMNRHTSAFEEALREPANTMGYNIAFETREVLLATWPHGDVKPPPGPAGAPIG